MGELRFCVVPRRRIGTRVHVLRSDVVDEINSTTTTIVVIILSTMDFYSGMDISINGRLLLPLKFRETVHPL